MILWNSNSKKTNVSLATLKFFSMIIQRLIDNFNVEKNEKECIEQQMLNKDRDYVETKTRLVLLLL